MIKWLVENQGFSPMDVYKLGYTCFHQVAQTGQLEVLSWMIEHIKEKHGKEALNILNYKTTIEGLTAPLLAVHNGHIEVIRYFLENKEDMA